MSTKAACLKQFHNVLRAVARCRWVLLLLVVTGCGRTSLNEPGTNSSVDVGGVEGGASGQGEQPGAPCSVDSDCGNSFLACSPKVVSMCRDPNSMSVDAGDETSLGNIPANLPACPTQTQVNVNLCSVRYQLPCQVDSDCGPDGFTCNTYNPGQCSSTQDGVACTGDAECPQGWSCYVACQCADAVGVKRCYPPFAVVGCDVCLAK